MAEILRMGCKSNIWKVIYQTGNNILKLMIQTLICYICHWNTTGIMWSSVMVIIIYMNDIARTSKHFDFIIYADDSC